MGYQTVTGHIGKKHQFLGFLRDEYSSVLPDWLTKKISTYPNRVDQLLRFPGIVIEQFQRERVSLDKFSLAYSTGDSWVDSTAHTRRHHLEGDKNIVLFQDSKPLCNASFLEISYDSEKALFIKQLQGVRGCNSTDNFDLSNFAWTDALVSIVEELARIRGIDYILIQPCDLNKWSKVRGTSQGRKIYDETAEKLNYQKISNLPIRADKRKIPYYYFKSLKNRN